MKHIDRFNLVPDSYVDPFTCVHQELFLTPKRGSRVANRDVPPILGRDDCFVQIEHLLTPSPSVAPTNLALVCVSLVSLACNVPGWFTVPPRPAHQNLTVRLRLFSCVGEAKQARKPAHYFLVPFKLRPARCHQALVRVAIFLGFCFCRNLKNACFFIMSGPTLLTVYGTCFVVSEESLK